MGTKYPFISHQKLEEKIQFLKNGFLISDRYCFDQFDERYERNIRFYNYFTTCPEEFQLNIQKSVVTIIGCGGIGNLISHMLVNSGIKKVILVDDDVVEITNLTRQILFTEADIGAKKVNVLKQRLLERNSEAEIETVDLRIDKSSDLENLERSDLYVVSADHPKDFIYWVNSYSVENKQPYINVGYLSDIAIVGPFYVPDVSACFSCGDLTEDLKSKSSLHNEIKEINQHFKNITFASVNGLAASYAFMDIVRFFTGSEILSMNKRIGIHTSKIAIETMMFEKNKFCHVCAK